MSGKQLRLIWLAMLVSTCSLTWSGWVQAAFTEIAVSAGIVDSTDSFGAGWADYDGDGDFDLFVARSANTSALYRNEGNGTFTDVTAAAGVGLAAGEPAGVGWGDYDNDGDPDLYVSNRRGVSVLFRNDGDGSFTDVTVAAGVGNDSQAQGVAWGDFDNDSFLDLYVSNRYGANKVDALYHNNGDGTFTNVASSLGLANSLNTFGAVWWDPDFDNDLDLYLSVDFDNDRSYANNGDGTFTDNTVAAGFGPPEHAMGIAVGDYDGDLDLDIFIDNNQMGAAVDKGPSLLYRNNGDGTFTDVTLAAGLPDRETVDWGTNFIDYDNDGDEDLAVVAGGLLTTTGQPNVLFANQGNGTFSDVTVAETALLNGSSFGSAFADFDKDGDLDWFIANENGEQDRLLRNNGPAGNWIVVKPVGTTTNRDGIGARVFLTAGGKTMVRGISSGTSFLSSQPYEAWFGLGSATVVDRIEVHWPSGTVDVRTNVAINNRLTVVEGEVVTPTEPTVVNVNDADLIVSGTASGEQVGGFNVPLGADLNGDGVEDMVIGAPNADPNGANDAGRSYIIFGGSNLPTDMDVTNANVTINGIDAGDRSGLYMFSRGDLNADGIDDLVIGAPRGDAGDNALLDGGEAYILFGRTSWPSVINLATDANVRINSGIADARACGMLSTGDVNGDGVTDLLCGARGANSAVGDKAGQAYILFGRSVWPTVMNLSVDADVTIDAIQGSDELGFQMASGGDINNDGIDDIAVGAWWAEPDGFSNGDKRGEAFVWFGRKDWPDNLSATAADVYFGGLYEHGNFGTSIDLAGDVNGDGIDDLLLGAKESDLGHTGEFYLIYGRNSFPSVFDLATMTDVLFTNTGVGDEAGDGTITNDLNGDGYSDILISNSDKIVNDQDRAGEVYLIHGGPSLPSNIDVLTGSTTTYRGNNANDQIGSALNMSAGDLNHDGAMDLAIGALGADPNGVGEAGMAFVFYGTGNAPPQNQTPSAVISANPLSGTAPLLVSFDGSSSSDPDGSITSYLWDFGDGATAVGAGVSHTYTVAGTYTASLTVTDNQGATHASTATINVSPVAVVDVVDILRLVWDSTLKTLDVRVSSSLNSSVSVEVVGFGALKWDAGRNAHVGRFSGVTTAPASVTVISSGGGTDTGVPTTR